MRRDRISSPSARSVHGSPPDHLIQTAPMPSNHDPWAVYELLLAQTTSTAQVDEVLIGQVWTMCRSTDGGLGLAMTPPVPASRTLTFSGALQGRPIHQLAAWVRSWNPTEAVLGMAAINTLINRPDNATSRKALRLEPGNLAVFEHFAPRLEGRRVVVVGHYPGLERFADRLALTILERLPAPGDLPDPACEFVIPEADWVFLTASSLPNKTFPRLAQLAVDAQLVLMGPTTPWLPQLATFGVDYLAGVVVEDPALLRCTIAEGGGTRLFDGAVRYAITPLG